MSTTQPIRSREALQAFKNYYLKQSPNLRNYVLIYIGLHTALRISDILNLRWEMIYNRETAHFYSHIKLQEQKTGKNTRILLSNDLREVVANYHRSLSFPTEGYLFPSSKKRSGALSRYQAYRIIRRAAQEVGLEETISCHSLRKTFGYHAWKQGTPPALLMEIYNHSSYQITKHYLGIEQDDKDEVFAKINL